MTEKVYIDEATLDRLTKWGGSKLVIGMIDLFLDDAPEKMESVIRATKEEDWEAVEGAVHSLKSSAGNVGAPQLQQIAKEIEEYIRDESIEAAVNLMEDLERVFKEVISLLEQIKARMEE